MASVTTDISSLETTSAAQTEDIIMLDPTHTFYIEPILYLHIA